MGWTSSSYWTHKQDVVNAILADYKASIITYKVNGNEMWAVMNGAFDTNPPIPYLAVFVLEKSQGMWAYKEMDESMHPYYYNCPDAFLLVPVANEAWRAARLEWLKKQTAQKALKNSIKVGEVITLTNGWMMEIANTRPFLGRRVIDGLISSQVYRIPKKMLQEKT